VKFGATGRRPSTSAHLAPHKRARRPKLPAAAAARCSSSSVHNHNKCLTDPMQDNKLVACGKNRYGIYSGVAHQMHCGGHKASCYPIKIASDKNRLGDCRQRPVQQFAVESISDFWTCFFAGASEHLHFPKKRCTDFKNSWQTRGWIRIMPCSCLVLSVGGPKKLNKPQEKRCLQPLVF